MEVGDLRSASGQNNLRFFTRRQNNRISRLRPNQEKTTANLEKINDYKNLLEIMIHDSKNSSSF
jgi:hypothetical protein